jgi:nitroimidazol reductase NimA-like FMN-containing flavoprotein (pyridoxamine 5'-phosphate oxidase superfamily)
MGHYHVRRSDRELATPEQLDSVLRRGRFATIAMISHDEPYAVTLSYGFDAPGRALYFHLARKGRKVDALAADARVCATVVIDGGYEPGACEHHYESVVITGRMRVVGDPDEARHGMRVLLAHLEEDPDTLWEKHDLGGDKVYERMSVARLDIAEITGKAGS